MLRSDNIRVITRTCVRNHEHPSHKGTGGAQAVFLGPIAAEA
jgi:hypothetical protein